MKVSNSLKITKNVSFEFSWQFHFFSKFYQILEFLQKKKPFEWDIFEWFFTIVNPGNFLQRIGYTPQNQKDCEECYGAAVPSRYLAWHESKWKIFIPENPCEYYCTRTFHFFQGNCQRRRIFSLDDDLIPSSIRWSNHRVITREKNRIDDDPDNWAGNSKLLLVFKVKVKKISFF